MERAARDDLARGRRRRSARRRSSAAATSRYAVRNGRPASTRRITSSVASAPPASAAAQRARSTPSRGTACGDDLEHRPGAVEPAHQRLLEQLEVAVIAAGELALDLEHRDAGRPRAPRPAPRVSSKRSGFRLCGMMLDPVASSAGRTR